MNYKPIGLRKTVTTAGTRVQVSATRIIGRGVVIKALDTNTGKIYVGDVTVDSTHGIPLRAGESLDVGGPGGETLFIDLSEVYLDSSVNGEGVDVGYLVKV